MKKPFLLLLFLCLACTSKPKTKAIHIGLTHNKQTLKFSGLDAAIIGEISRDTSAAVWQSLVPVYRIPADTDMKDYQRPQPGKYQVADSIVTFTPDTPFLKQQTYFVRYYRYGQHNSPADFMKGDKKLGKQPYIDLIFKP